MLCAVCCAACADVAGCVHYARTHTRECARVRQTAGLLPAPVLALVPADVGGCRVASFFLSLYSLYSFLLCWRVLYINASADKYFLCGCLLQQV